MRLRQVRSSIGASGRQVATLHALGLGRIGATADRDDSPAIRGMVAKVRHLLDIEIAAVGSDPKQV